MFEKEVYQEDHSSVNINAYVTEKKLKTCQIPCNSIILLILLGFFFILLGVIELVSTYQSNSTTITLTQQGNVLSTTQYTQVSFTQSAEVGVYLQIQNLTQFTHLTSIGWGEIEQIDPEGDECQSYRLNSDENKTIAIDGSSLNPNQVAIPCGLYAGMYFGGSVSVSYANGTLLSFDQTDLTYFSYQVENFNASAQWVDLLSQPFQSWMEQNAEIVSTKLIGRLPSNFQGFIQIEIALSNGFPKSIGPVSLILAANKTFGVTNLSFCIINFFQSLCLFVFAFVIFSYEKVINRELEEEGKTVAHEIELRSSAESQSVKSSAE